MRRTVRFIDGARTKVAGLVADMDSNLHRLNPTHGCRSQDGTGWKDGRCCRLA